VPELAVLENKPQIAIHRLDCEYFGKDAYASHSISMTAAMGDSSYVDVFWPAGRQIPEPDILLEEGSTAGPFTVLHLPGHTPGSIALWDKAEGVLFSGDTLFNYAYGRTDLPGGSEKDIFSSLRRLFEMDGNIKVFPGHGSATTIELERRQTARLL
jgi:glyoxylase-like metal-dependent hydrolase (beta-lactamase superfamily II)